MLNTLPRQAKAFTVWKKLDAGTTITQDNFEGIQSTEMVILARITL